MLKLQILFEKKTYVYTNFKKLKDFFIKGEIIILKLFKFFNVLTLFLLIFKNYTLHFQFFYIIIFWIHQKWLV